MYSEIEKNLVIFLYFMVLNSKQSIECDVEIKKNILRVMSKVFCVVDNPPVCNLTMYFSCAVPTISELFAFGFGFSKLNKSYILYNY